MTNLRHQASSLSLVLLFIAMLTAGSPAQAEQQSTQTLTAAQLEQLVAPIALYPDPLLSQVLMASTYPLEVVEAARWSRDNPNVTGTALEDAMQKQNWDPSVKALTAVPQTLQMMDDQIPWTQDLGDAFLAQQTDVLDAVQRLRARADKAGNLKTTPQQKVARTPRPPAAAKTAGAPAQAYIIEPADPEEIYVPVYDPRVVYGDWPYPEYEPFYWYPPDYVGTGWYGFGAGFLTGAAIWGAVNWWNRNVYVDPRRYNQFNRTNINNPNWSHNVNHRRGVPYNNPRVAARFGDQGRGKARDAARQKAAQGKGGKGQGGMGMAGMGQTAKAGMGMAGMGQAGMAGMGTAGMGMAGMGTAGMGMAGMGTAGMGMAGGTRVAGMGGPMGGGRGYGGMSFSGGRSLSGGRGFSGGGRGFSGGGRAGGFRGGGGGGRGGGGRGGGGRRSDVAVKHDISLLGYLDNGLGFYRFAYRGSETAYVGVMAQEVQRVMPEAVTRGRDGYLRVFYGRLGLKFQTYEAWLASGAQIPAVARAR